jgi:molybdopterin molybdotransferase
MLPSVEQARERFLEVLPEAPPEVEDVPLAEAVGRVTAEGVRAGEDVPGFDRSVMDGFAVRAENAVAGARLRLVGSVRMGEPARVAVGPGECAAVPTGGMIPEGADAVVPLEEARVADGQVEVLEAASVGRHLVRRGEDVRRGAVLVPAGRRLRPADVGALAAVGCTVVRVRRRLRVAVVSTGDELVPAASAPGPGQVRDSNGWSLAAALRRDGFVPVPLGIVPDRRELLLRRFTEALAEADVLLVSGGSSVGDRDYIPDVLDAMGTPGVLVRGIAVKPGKPTALAVLGGKVAVALPGHPVSALVIYEVVVRPALLRLAGEARPAPPAFVSATLGAPVSAPRERDFLCRVRLEGDVAMPVEGGSALLTTMVQADGLLFVRRGERRRTGERVEVRLLA